MSAEAEDKPCECPAGAPAWLATFADLMTLLMCFFVLLLSFSEMDAQKFKKAVGSLRLAFGVQREIVTEQTPLGESIVAQEFSPGEPTVLDYDLPPFMTSDAEALKRRREQMLEQDMVDLSESNGEVLSAGLKAQVDTGSAALVKDRVSHKIVLMPPSVFEASSAQFSESFSQTLRSLITTLPKTKGALWVESYTGDFEGKDGSGPDRVSNELAIARASKLFTALSQALGKDSERLSMRVFSTSQSVGVEQSKSASSQEGALVLRIELREEIMRDLDL